MTMSARWANRSSVEDQIKAWLFQVDAEDAEPSPYMKTVSPAQIENYPPRQYDVAAAASRQHASSLKRQDRPADVHRRGESHARASKANRSLAVAPGRTNVLCTIENAPTPHSLDLQAPFRQGTDDLHHAQTAIPRPKRQRKPSTDSSVLQPAPRHDSRARIKHHREHRGRSGRDGDDDMPIDEPDRVRLANEEGLYRKGSRRKTRPDLYDTKPEKNRKSRPERVPKQAWRKKRNKQRPAVKGIVSLPSKYVSKERLTLKPSYSLGLFNRGRKSSPSRECGAGDLAYAEMRFLQDTKHRQTPKFTDKDSSFPPRNYPQGPSPAVQGPDCDTLKGTAVIDDSSDGLFVADDRSHKSPTPIAEPDLETTNLPFDDEAPACCRIDSAGAAMNSDIARLADEKSSASPNDSSTELTWPASELCLGENETRDSPLPLKCPPSPVVKAPATCASHTYHRQSTSQTSHVAADTAALSGCCACNCHGRAQKQHSPGSEEPPTPISSPGPSMQAHYRERNGILGSFGRYPPLANWTMTPNVQMSTTSDRRARAQVAMDRGGSCDLNPASISDRRHNLDTPKPTETGQPVGLLANSQRWSAQIPTGDTALTRRPPNVSRNASIRETRRKGAVTVRTQSLEERCDAPSAGPVVDNCILEVASVSHPGRLELWGDLIPSDMAPISRHDVAGPASTSRPKSRSAQGPVQDRKSLDRAEVSRGERLQSQAATGEQGSPSMSDLLPSDLSLLLAEDLADEADAYKAALQSEDGASLMGSRGYPDRKARSFARTGEAVHELATHHFAGPAQEKKFPMRAAVNDKKAPDEFLFGFWRRRTLY